MAPRLEHDPGATYPEAALRAGFFESVSVPLVLEINTDGSLRRVSLERPGRAEFDQAALTAAEGLRFAPASSRGVAVPARIRFRYIFTPPPPVLAIRIVDKSTGAGLGGVRVRVRTAAGGESIFETQSDGSFESDAITRGPAEIGFSVKGYSSQTTRVELTPGLETRVEVRLAPSETAKAPGATAAVAPPVLEVLVQGEKLAPAVSSFSRAEVRQMPGAFGDPFRAIEALPGVTPIGSGLPFFYVRGAPPGNVGYFLDGVRIPFLYHVAIGPSVIHPALVDRVDLFPGGYPARFGRFAGGIVSAKTLPPSSETRGEANLRLFDAGALLETSFDDGRGNVLLGGRYSYTAALFSLLVPELKLDYRDYQARVGYDLSQRHRVSAFALGSYDLLAQKQGGGVNVLFGSEFYRLDLRHDYRFDAGALRTAVTLGFDQTHMGDEGNAIDRSIGVRTELAHRLGRRALLRAGADVGFDAYSVTRPKYADPDSPEIAAFERNNPSRIDSVTGLHGDLVLAVAPGIELTPGVRLDFFESQSATAFAIDPRIAARFAISDRFSIIHAYGLVHQPPSFVVPLPGRNPSGLAGGLQQSLQTSAGAELKLADGTTLTGTLFHNAFFRMTDALATNHDGPPDARPVERSLGSALGFEAFVHRRLTQRFGGFLSYTFSRSMRSVGRERFPSSFDRTHVANVAVAYDLGRNWRAGTRFVFYTGTPKTADLDGLTPALRVESQARGDPFYRLDLRLEKRWNASKTLWISLVLEVMNATLNKEPFGDQELGPITIPSLGAELGF